MKLSLLARTLTPRAELAPVALGLRAGRPYERRLRVILERAWPAFEAALGAAGLADRSGEVATALFAEGSVERPADDPRRTAEEHWRAVEARLVALMTEEGLDLELACARLALSPAAVLERCREDPLMHERLEIAWLRGTAKLHGAVWQRALKGSDRAAQMLGSARDPRRFAGVAAREPSEEEISKTRAFSLLLDRVIGALGPGHTCEACGGCACRDRVKEAVG
jgi:hypothetical protein